MESRNGIKTGIGIKQHHEPLLAGLPIEWWRGVRWGAPYSMLFEKNLVKIDAPTEHPIAPKDEANTN